MARPDCECVSVDSPLAVTAAAIGIATFAIAVVGFVAAAIAIIKSYQNAAQDANRFEEVYNAAVNEIEQFRFAFALTPDYFTSDGEQIKLQREEKGSGLNTGLPQSQATAAAGVPQLGRQRGLLDTASAVSSTGRQCSLPLLI